VVINVLLVWLPLLVHLAAPGLTTRYLTQFNEWLRVHGRVILTWVLVVVGAIMVGNGIYGLAVVR
jgi:Sap, sulfolipid-1-addressing protein